MVTPVQYDYPPAIYESVGQNVDGGGKSGAVSVLTAQRNDPGDPWEAVNRALYGTSEVLDRVAIRPAAMAYRRILPRPIRNGIHHVLVNLDEPRLAVDHLLQGRLRRAGQATLRFSANSTIGLLGVFDVADRLGLKRTDTDFGITLGRLHVGAGPYLYIPVLGPSSVRDAVGTGIDFALDPLNWFPYSGSTVVTNSAAILQGVDARARIDRDLVDLKRSSVDPYATIRSVYTQMRGSEVRGGALDVKALPDFPEEEISASPPSSVNTSTPEDQSTTSPPR